MHKVSSAPFLLLSQVFPHVLDPPLAAHMVEPNQVQGTVKYYAQIHLQVWQNSVCTGQGNLPLIT